jgi:hypothetical protein
MSNQALWGKEKNRGGCYKGEADRVVLFVEIAQDIFAWEQ